MPLASHHLIGLDELAHEPQVSQVSTSPALAFWVSATLPDFLLFLNMGTGYVTQFFPLIQLAL